MRCDENSMGGYNQQNANDNAQETSCLVVRTFDFCDLVFFLICYKIFYSSVTSDRSFGVLTSFLSLPDTKQLVLQLGMTWNQIERVMESAGDPQIAKVQLLIEWRHRCGDRDDLAEQLIQGLRDIQNNLYASLVQRIHKRGSRLKPADMLDVCGR